jgi:hypothetical protein
MGGFAIARQALNSVLNNVLNSRVVPIHFHKSPGNDQGGDRAISGIRWQVTAQGMVIQRGTTGADGKIEMTVRGGRSMLQLLEGTTVIAEYDVTIDNSALAAANTTLGQKQRLRLLGYHLGHGGPEHNGVDGNANPAANHMEFERSILDLQVEHDRLSDAVINATTQTDLTNDAGA